MECSSAVERHACSIALISVAVIDGHIVDRKRRWIPEVVDTTPLELWIREGKEDAPWKAPTAHLGIESSVVTQDIAERIVEHDGGVQWREQRRTDRLFGLKRSMGRFVSRLKQFF